MSNVNPAVEMPLTLGRRMAEARRQAGYDQDELAARWGESRSTISRWERDLGQPRFAQMVDLSRISNWSLDLFANAVAEIEPEGPGGLDGPSVIDGSSFACTTDPRPAQLATVTELPSRHAA